MPHTNLDRFKSDLDRLIEKGGKLQISMLTSAYKGNDLDDILKKAGLDEKASKEAKASASNFGVDYQAWYSESLSLIGHVLPQRLEDFKAQYEGQKGRKAVDHLTYVMSDFLIGLRTSRGGDIIADSSSAIPKFQVQLAILLAVRQRFESSLFEIKQILQADLFDSELSSARELLRKNFVRAAGAIAGVVIEKHLQQVCADHKIAVRKQNPGISDLNEALKAAGVIDVPQWRHITLMGDYRNLCDHKKRTDPTIAQVDDLLNGAEKIIKTIT